MSVQKAISTEQDPKAAAQQLCQAIGEDAKLVLFFASSAYDPDAISAAVGEAFSGAQTIGCMTSGELISGQMTKNAVVAMGFGGDVIGDVTVQAIADATNRDQVTAALTAAAGDVGSTPSALDAGKLAGIVLTDGMSVGEEIVMERLGEMSNVTFVGGSAGDDLKFESAPVYANGKAYRGGSVLALFAPVGPFEIVKTQSFEVLEPRLVVTKADEAARTVIEFNGKPAVQAYAEAIGCDVDQLPDHFMSNPLGLLVDGGEPFVRSPQQLNGDAVVFYCRIAEGMELALLQGRNICTDTKAALDAANVNGASVKGIVNFHCILRTLELEAKEQTQEYGELFSDIPMVGFSTYGESYIGHINQTSTILVLR